MLRSTGLSALLITFSLAAPVATAEYTIQVGAFSKPSQAFADTVRELGEVNTAQKDNGITVFTVGRYATSSAASDDVERVRARFPDAFVRSMPASAQSTRFDQPEPVAAPEAKPRMIANTRADSDLWNDLSDEERRKVVYLDGVLHVKQGESFVPLAEYRRQQTP